MSLSPLTLGCRATVPSRNSVSSRGIGWTSLLLDLHTGIASRRAYASVPTPDARVGVSMSGRYSCDFRVSGRWRRDEHGPGTICIHRTGESEHYRFDRPRDPDFTMALLYLPADLLVAAAEEFRRPGRRPGPPVFRGIVGRDPAIAETAHALVGAMERGEADFYAQTAAAWLAAHLVARYGEGAAGEEGRRTGDLSDRRLERTIEFMSAHFAEPLTLDRLAREACISKFHFARLFRRRTGQSPYRYLTELRLDTARRMLVTTDDTIGQVAGACGFESTARFTAAFTRRFGVPPSAYRRLD